MSWKTIGEEEENAVKFVLRNKTLSTGCVVRLLETKLAYYLKKKYCVATVSCTYALELLLSELSASRKMVYVSNPELFCETLLGAIERTGNTYTTSLGQAEVAVVVHFGEFNSKDYQKAVENNAVVIDDVTQTPFLKTFGDYKILSLGAGKPITACEGGAILTNDEKLANAVRARRDSAARLSDVHAAIGLEQLRKFEGELKK